MVIVDNERRLRNLSGACFFLENYGCRVIQNRPEGCRLYPLVLGRGSTIGLDGDCPQADKFIFNGEDISKLHELANRIRKKRETSNS